ncbi:hypothetical protein [Nonomuraea jiangxiensis]|uniref:hypothetical protein n=1 Tax=Nonomuraea jiangxiensis TaxID=633440 RepID=UPI000B896DE5|nr:hypothetical protein [Nonomuraea jiangxiensis]
MIRRGRRKAEPGFDGGYELIHSRLDFLFVRVLLPQIDHQVTGVNAQDVGQGVQLSSGWQRVAFYRPSGTAGRC